MRTDFSESHHRFDQCGIVMYLDSENWLKASVEYENEDSSFKALFSNMQLTECLWKAHDGQQPDQV